MIFSYEELQAEDLLVAAITIPLQERPIYLRKGVGKLKANVVYIRRGDSTGEAPPDEIVKMGQVGFVADVQPSLNVEFADLKERRVIGTELELHAIEFQVPHADSIPDYGRVRSGRFMLSAAVSGNNPDYLREMAEYISDYGRFQPIGFAVENSSTAPAINVVLRMRIPSTSVEVRSQDDMPDEPSKVWLARLRAHASFLQKSPISVSHHGDFYPVRIDLETIQPGITEFSSAPIFIGSPKPFDLSLDAVLSGDNVTIPILQQIRFKAQVESRQLSIADLNEYWGVRPHSKGYSRQTRL